MKKVLIYFPNMDEKNERDYLVSILHHSMKLGEVPILLKPLLTATLGIANPNMAEHFERLLEPVTLEYFEIVDALVVYNDFKLDEEVNEIIGLAQDLGTPVEYRQIYKNPTVNKDAFLKSMNLAGRNQLCSHFIATYKETANETILVLDCHSMHIEYKMPSDTFDSVPNMHRETKKIADEVRKFALLYNVDKNHN